MSARLHSVSLAGFAVLCSLAAGCPSEVDCEAGDPCEDSFHLEIIPGGAGFEIGSYHFEIEAGGVAFFTDCSVTGDPDATSCEPLTREGDGELDWPTFEMVRDDNGVITHFDVAFESAPTEVQVRVVFGGEVLTDTTFTEYEEVQIDPTCPVQCRVFDDRLTVLP